ncbi:GntR family transcriptional regulator [Microbacterium invictum]|uniref:DNA-binding GntR family transcriptional regulator n=1 Tax=Microbacterium invictum TaxID=515415 RepID=A0AA40VNM0_9MICO|nr:MULTISPECIES: GntR family transcriptional regulator [Microbacterium]MBB4140583.1 DNA-binding GntR family transcriptional regulator [Microbacterium invictum]
MPATLSPIDVTDGMILGDAVYEEIGAAILDGRLQPGQRLRDVDVATQLGVSRTPVREALQRLERFGLVEVAVGRYTRVSEIDDQLRADTAEFTAYFMGNALRIALQSCSDEQLAELVSAVDAVVAAAASDDALQLFDSSTAMFVLATRATGNVVFTTFIREASLAILRNLRGWQPFLTCPLARTTGYTTLRDCIAARDGAGAEQTLRHLHGLA